MEALRVVGSIAGDGALIAPDTKCGGRPFGLTAAQIVCTHAMVNAGKIDLYLAAAQFGVHTDTILRGSADTGSIGLAFELR